MSKLENNVSNRTFEELFRIPAQFEIPFFQRGYVWTKQHWVQLFDDIRDQVMPEIESLENIADAEHFFGPIVVLEKTSQQDLLRKFLVIDGQQRITTVYLLLATIKNLIDKNAYQSSQANEYCSELEKYVLNEVGKDNTDDYNKLKVLSSKGDRLPTYLLVFNDTNPVTPLLSVDQQLYVPGRNNIDALKKYVDRKLSKDFADVQSLWKLSQILLRSLKIVWIGLDEKKDDPQAIFESLNDRGTPLTAMELICNYLFKPLMKSDSNAHENLHSDYWLDADRRIDSKGTFEDYLRIIFSVGEKKLVGKGRRIYVHFKNKNKQITSGEAKKYLEEIKHNVDVYNQVVDPIKHRNSNKDIANLLIKIKATRMEACNVFLFALLQANGRKTISDDSIKSILKETLTLLVRRKTCTLATTKYDVIFPNMLSHIANEPNPAKAFKDKVVEEEYFVSNREFENALIEKALYRDRDLPFTRMILQEIDRSMQIYDQLPDYSTLETVEHVLPQSLTKEWEEHIGADALNVDLKQYVSTLGNLCLLSQRANSSAGQNPFVTKIKDYTDVSALTTDLKNWKRDEDDANRIWNIDAIKERSLRLSKKALKIWAWSE